MKTMQELENEFYYLDVWELWDGIAEHAELIGATDWELCQVFADAYGVDAQETFQYFCCEY